MALERNRELEQQLEESGRRGADDLDGSASILSSQSGWVRANVDSPTDWDEQKEAIVFNAGTKELHVKKIDNLQGKIAIPPQQHSKQF